MMWEDEKLIRILKEGGVVVMPTDTIYGIVGKAEDSATVERIYKIRKRDVNKPCIILIGDVGELEKFSIILSEKQKNLLKKYWLDSMSIVLDCPDEKFKYLHRGMKSLAFRLPTQKGLQNLLKETGPLTAPSANTEDSPPSQNITEAKEYFGDLVDLYLNGGLVTSRASKVIRLHPDGTVSIIRP